MIITQTPLRVSLAGGGTDFPAFFDREEGCVLSSAIDKYIYVIIKERFDRKIRVGYSRTEMVDDLEQVEHELVRECLRRTGIRSGIEIATMADIPSEGSGLGSSGSVTVGLLNAMYAYQGILRTAEDLAREASEIEIDILGRPIGKQDQYIAAYGGLRLFRFRAQGEVRVETPEIDDAKRRRLGENLMLFFTGVTRSADEILCEQQQNIPGRFEILRKMKTQALDVRDCLSNGANLNRLGRILDRGWELKRQLASRISNDTIDDIYELAIDNGAVGGKICGAGGGGFLLLCCPPDRQLQVRAALSHLRELPFNLERDGTKVIFNCRR
jgi:D-glycero-alpha-D-manno-heptose-7-phosphate kinase